MSTTAANQAKVRGVRGLHVLAAMLTFFAIIIVADATMIYKALTTFGGVDNPNAYRVGVAYNLRIARDTEQTLTGWRDDVQIVDAQTLRVLLYDRDSGAVTDKKLTARIGRPATNRFDQPLALVEVTPGRYEARLPDAREGSWIVDLSVYVGGASPEPLYQTRRRVWIKP
jgi:nitrogen fixation protein FixH